MNLSDFMLMRHELSLIVIILVMLVGEIFFDGKSKNKLMTLGIILFAIHTIIGFFPMAEGELFGGMYRTNRVIWVMKSILNIGTLIVLFQSAEWLKQKVSPHNNVSEFFVLIFSTLVGMYYLVSAGDFLMFYLGLELASLPLAALAAFNGFKTKSAEAGIKLILNSAIASVFSIFGISLLYGTSGTIFFSELAPLLNGNGLQMMGFIFFISGLAFKISLVPFHLWTADVYEGAPISVTSYLSVVSKGAAVFIMMIFLMNFAGNVSEMWKDILYVLSILTMTIGNLFALRQKNMKRFLAFSSIAQAGFILLGFLANDQTGASTILYFIFIYVFTNLAAFGVVQAISVTTGKENMDDYTGLYRTNPLLSLVLMLALFSLAGIPPVAGFFGKFFLFSAAASKGYYWLVIIAVVNVTISLYYYLLPIRAMFLRKSENAIAYFKSDIYMRIGLVICVVGIFAIGVYSPIFDYIYELVQNKF